MNKIGEGQGFVAYEKDGKVILEIDPATPGVRSQSGKSMVIASSRGNIALPVGGKVYNLGLNFYTKA